MSLFVRVYRDRTAAFVVTITNDAGTTVTFNSGDNFRVKIGYAGQTPILDLESDAASSNGSSVGASNPSTIVLKEGDADLLTPGPYDIEASITDSDGIKAGDKGVLYVHDMMAGGVD